jgi:hypothetical protein
MLLDPVLSRGKDLLRIREKDDALTGAERPYVYLVAVLGWDRPQIVVLAALWMEVSLI